MHNEGIMLTQGIMFGIAGQNLTTRLRKKAFEAMLKQEMGWFDRPRYNRKLGGGGKIA